MFDYKDYACFFFTQKFLFLHYRNKRLYQVHKFFPTIRNTLKKTKIQYEFTKRFSSSNVLQIYRIIKTMCGAFCSLKNSYFYTIELYQVHKYFCTTRETLNQTKIQYEFMKGSFNSYVHKRNWIIKTMDFFRQNFLESNNKIHCFKSFAILRKQPSCTCLPFILLYFIKPFYYFYMFLYK